MEVAVKAQDTEKSLVVYEENNKQILEAENATKSKKKILPEEDYTEEMEKIITRDFFPDLLKLKVQNEYLDALEKGDVAKIQQLQFTYRPTTGTVELTNRSTFSTPLVCQTPDVGLNATPQINDTSKTEEKKEKTLDQFFANTTSEDNASFETIMQKSAVEHQQKYPWLYKDENMEQKKLDDMLALPPPETKSNEEKPAELTMWSYKNKNALMYVPDGAEMTPAEKIKYQNKKIIVHENTRFKSAPFDEEANKKAIAEAASVQAKMKEGKVGIDGKEILLGDSPEVNGYGFIATPSPAPGETAEPIMTWGEIEGTPFHLDGSDTPLHPNSSSHQFKMPNLSAREKIALSLADKAAKKYRKIGSLKKGASPFLSPKLKFGSSTPSTQLEKLLSMSPAAQKLACTKLGLQHDTDHALRASYSPSPLHMQNRSQTPSRPSTPANSTPSSWQQNKPNVITPSQTQMMLNLTNRKKAKDFF